MTQVFTSYSRRDKETVDQIVGVIENTGINVWIDREDIKAGNMWRVQIVEAIDTCAAFLLMLSPNSAASDNVRKEIDLAEGSERPIFAVMLQPVKLPADIRYQLAGLQLIDVQKLGFDNAVARLLEDLKEHIKKIAAAAEASVRQVELVIQGIDISAFGPEKQEQLLAFIASLANTDRSQVKLESMAAGSVHVFVNVPASAAYQLKTLALNRDPRFKEMGITSLRLDGDKKFINVSLGKPILAATIGPLAALWLKVPTLFAPMLGATAGKVLTLLLITAVIAGAGILVPATFAPAPALTPTSISTSLPTWTSTLAATDTSTPADTPSPTSTVTETPTATQTLTATVTPTPVPTYLTLTGVITNPLSNLVACRYGPGDIYLYRFGPQNGIQMDISGKVEIRTLRETETWLWGLLDGYLDPCWVNAKYVRLNGDLVSLETVYPGKVDLPILPQSSWRWPAPQNVKAFRQGDQINIYWDFYDVPLGERESESSPRYVLELWLCQDGEVAFTPRGANESSLQVTDEAGCAEPSHGRIYLAEKHGYIGPVEIPWPRQATPTP
jgi:hypothetical protein